MVNITRYVGSRRIDKEVPKYQLISSHTAKKTFVSNSIALGVSLEVIKQITGNKGDKSFDTYKYLSKATITSQITENWNKI